MIYLKIVKVLFTSIFISLFSCSNTNSLDYSNNDIGKTDRGEITEIKINYVNWLVSTSYSVECDKFEKTFSKILKEKFIYNKSTIESIDNFLETTKQNNESIHNIDTRYKIILINENPKENDTICGSRFGIQTNGEKFMMSKDFQNYLRTLMQD